MTENPFYVLGLRPEARPMDVETEGQKLLGMLELDLKAARSYATPLGERPRDAELVRWAMAELRDPAKRLIHEIWAQPDPGDPRFAATEDDGNSDRLAPWDDALESFFRWR